MIIVDACWWQRDSMPESVDDDDYGFAHLLTCSLTQSLFHTHTHTSRKQTFACFVRIM